MGISQPIDELIRARRDGLSPAGLKIAEIVLREPEAVAFGTVADIAELAGTSPPTVSRFAIQLGLAGYVELQARLREELSGQLRPAAQRIRSRSRGDFLERVMNAELENVRRSLDDARGEDFDRAVKLLGDDERRVYILPSEQAAPVATHFASELSILRDGVELVRGSAFRVVSELSGVSKRDVVVVVDLRRHERQLLDANELVARRGGIRISISDSTLSPLSRGAAASLSVSAAAVGPFDSHVGILALMNAIIAAVASGARRRSTRRIDTLESTWVETGVLDPGE